MQSLRRKLSFRKKKEHVPACSQPHRWQEDAQKVREGTCCFQVRYMGCVEVFDSRGMHVCDEALQALKAQCKGKYQRAVLYVSGDALRVVDEISKSMIVDQTVEKVSFCTPDRNDDKGFAYICRDGTTMRWMCHGFRTVKETGERLSHAVGCSFALCMEQKKKLEKETGVTVKYNQARTSFERTGSFRQTTLTERIADPQSAILAEPVPVRSAANPYAVQRPHASVNLLERQGSFRGFEKLQETSSPFKRTLSLRLNELPSTLQRQNAISESPTLNGNGAVGGAIPEVPQEKEDSIAEMCQQLTQGLTALTGGDHFSGSLKTAAPGGAHYPLTHQASLPAASSAFATNHGQMNTQAFLTRQHTSPASQTLQPSAAQTNTNPWAGVPQQPRAQPSLAAATPPNNWAGPAASAAAVSSTNPFTQPSFATASLSQGRVASSRPAPAPGQTPNLGVATHGRSHSIDSGEMSGVHWHQQRTAPIRQYTVGAAAGAPFASHNGATSTSSSMSAVSNPWPTSSPPVPPSSSQGQGVDPFDVAWASKSVKTATSSPNPFNANNSVKQFEVQL